MLTRKMLLIVLLFIAGNRLAQVAKDYKDYAAFDFVPGETILLDDNLVNDKPGAAPPAMEPGRGKAAVIKCEQRNFHLH